MREKVEVEVKLYAPMNGAKYFEGVLKAYDGGSVTIEVNGKEIKIPMTRIAKINDSVILDKNYKSGGRGLYICSKECFEKATSNKKVSRAIRFFIDESLFDEALEILNGKR